MSLKDLTNTGLFGTNVMVVVKSKDFDENGVVYNTLAEGIITDDVIIQYSERYIEYFSWGDNNILIIHIC